MDQASPAQPPPTSTPQPSDPQPSSPAPPPQPPSSSSLLPLPSSSLPPSSSAIPSSPNPGPPTSQSQAQQPPSTQTSQTRPSLSRPWQQPSSFPHFSSHLHTSASSSSSPSPPPVPAFSSSSPAQRGGMAIGVPAHHPSPSPPPTSFSSLNPPSLGQQFGGLARSAANLPESVNSPSTSQVRQPIQGIQGLGTMGSFGSGSQIRPSGIGAHHQQRPVQSSVRPQTTPNTQSSTSQNFPGHSMLRVSSIGSPVSPSPSTSQGLQPHNQPWLSSGSQGKPPLPPPPFRPQISPQSLQQRSHISQQHHHPVSAVSQQPQSSSAQQQPPQQPPAPTSSHLLQEQHQQFPPSRTLQSLTHQQQISRTPGLGNQKPSLHTVGQPSTVQSGPPNRTTVSAEIGESCDRILSKRSIQELVAQIDPSERLEPEVEDILVDIADEYVESITTFGCSLAKHRKSNTLEAKDILVHLERNWNMTLPGFGGDEIKCYRKPFTSDIHKERLAAIKRSAASTETGNTRSSAGQAAGGGKGHLPKASMNIIGSPNPKIREAA
ncbi:hypothetical protein NMG60_11008426 [Bertholletia excelsa]